MSPLTLLRMRLLTKIQIALVLTLTAAAIGIAAKAGSGPWLPFWLLLVAITCSSGFKVALPNGDGSMSLNFPFILLGVIQLSPLQAMLLAGLSVAVQCRVRVTKALTLFQILFNVANAMLATLCAFLLTSTLQSAGMALAPALATGSVAYFACNTAAVAMVLASSGGGSILKIWRAEYPWYLPFYLVGALLAASVHWMSLRFGWSTALLLIPVVYTLYRAYTSQVNRMLERQQHLEETEALHLRTIEGLAMAIEAKDQGTHDHLFRVRHYVRAVGRALELSKLEMQALETAAFLHDIGKLAIPEHIINKPGKLTHEEFEKMKIHPVVGADILERVRFPYPVVPIVRSHHEWWNGAGYPDGLSGETIPIGARILTIVDCFDALVSDRPYRKGLSNEKAMEMIRNLSGRQFDPKVVAIFEMCHAEAEEQANTHAPTVFTPLNTDVEVSRGTSPGAGFAVAAASMKPGQLQNLSASSDHTDVLDASASKALDPVREEAARILEIYGRLGELVAPADLLRLLAPRLKRFLPFDTCALYVRHGQSLDVRYLAGEHHNAFKVPIPFGEGVSGWVAQNSCLLLNGNASVEPGVPMLPNGAPALRSGLAVPLLGSDKQIFGVLTLYAASEDAFCATDGEILETISEQLGLALHATVQRDEAKPVLLCDTVTGLPDAKHFYLQLEQHLVLSEELQEPLSVLILQLDRLDALKKRRGTDARDRIVSQVATSLRQISPAPDLFFRLCDTSFALLLPGTEESSLFPFSEAVRSGLEDCLQRSGQGSSLPFAIGMATSPMDGTTAEALLSTANRRLHRFGNADGPPAIVGNAALERTAAVSR